ncbi:TolC family protein [Roseivirga sp.]|uniref:TolC family protein n=1 Tax=Roseivirga sp. TaxID=1964215 RepID=UPI003B51ED98
MKKIIYILLIAAYFANVSLAQVEAPSLKVENLRPVEELIAVAINKSAAIKALNVSQQQTDQEIAMNRKKWMQHLSLAAGVNYGNGIVYDQLSGDQSGTSLTYLTRQNMTYNVGLNIRLPFTEVSSRRNEIKIKELEIDRLDYLKDEQAELLKKEIIKLYSDLKHYITSIAIQAEVVESNAMALDVAEGYFKAGKLPVEQYRMAVESNYSAKLQFEKAKNDAWLAYNTLKNLVGEDILK